MGITLTLSQLVLKEKKKGRSRGGGESISKILFVLEIPKYLLLDLVRILTAPFLHHSKVLSGTPTMAHKETFLPSKETGQMY